MPKSAEKLGVDFTSHQQQPIRWLSRLTLGRPAAASPAITQRPAPVEVEDVFAPAPDFKVGIFYIPKNWYRSLGVFVTVAVLLIIPFQAFSYYQQLQETKDDVLLLTNEAITQLKAGQAAAFSFDLQGASSQFDGAKQRFVLAQREVTQINAVTTELLKFLPAQGSSVNAGLSLLRGGELLAEVGAILTAAGDRFLHEHDQGYYQNLVTLETELQRSLTKFSEAKAAISQVKTESLPEDQQARFGQGLLTLPRLEQALSDMETLTAGLLHILGDRQWQRYLVLFANNNELRGGGGFLGSFALLDLDRGEIKNLEIPGGGTYDLQGSLVPRVISPEPLHLINSRWEFQDANWWPDFPTTAKKIEWFYQNASGPSTDGVILITATLMERLLAVVGPIAMPDYGRTIDSQNFVAETQKIVELEYDRVENRPKQFIADLAPELLDKVFTLQGDQFRELLEILQQGLNEKHLLLYFNDPETQNLIATLGWDGSVKRTQGDFLMVAHTNLAGGKTDGVINEVINHQAAVQDDGTIITTVNLTRTHTGVPKADIFTGVQNNSYVRFYVPLGSTLIAATGFEKPPENLFEQPADDLTLDLDLLSVETNRSVDTSSGTDVYQESGKTVFGNWLQLKPGETQTATITYRLPFKLAQNGQEAFYYSLLAQKQSGSTNSSLSSTLVLNQHLKPLTKYPPTLPEDGNRITFNAALTTDQFYGVALANQ